MQKRRIRMQLLTLIDNFLRYLVFYLRNNCYIINILICTILKLVFCARGRNL